MPDIEQHASKNKFMRYLSSAVFVLLCALALLYPFVYPPQSNPPITGQEDATQAIPNFAQFDFVIDKKRAFFAYLTPEINKQNAIILDQRLWLMGLKRKLASTDSAISSADQKRFDALRGQYKIEEEISAQQALPVLLNRVDILPLEMVLVQAANESAWGTSRFARKGYNFFGLWCFKPGCGFVPIRRQAGAINEVAKFPDLAYAVKTYLTNLNRHPAYQQLRDIRQHLREQQQDITAEALIQGLMSYSERGQAYIDELLDMVRINRKYMQI